MLCRMSSKKTQKIKKLRTLYLNYANCLQDATVTTDGSLLGGGEGGGGGGRQQMSKIERWAQRARRAGVLRCVTVCCGVLQCVAVCCGVLRCVAV